LNADLSTHCEPVLLLHVLHCTCIARFDACGSIEAKAPITIALIKVVAICATIIHPTPGVSSGAARPNILIHQDAHFDDFAAGMHATLSGEAKRRLIANKATTANNISGTRKRARGGCEVREGGVAKDGHGSNEIVANIFTCGAKDRGSMGGAKYARSH